MKKFKRWFVTALFILLGMEVLTIAPKRLGKREEANEEKKEKVSSSVATTAQIMRGVKLLETGAEGKKWELEADYAQGYKEKGSWKLQGVVVHYYGVSDVSYKVTGDSGSIEIETKDMEIYGNVVMETSDGYLMKSQYLKFNSKKHDLTTDDFISITGPKKEGLFELTAKGFRADLKTNIMDFNHDVKAVRAVNFEKEMNIKSDQAQISANANLAKFQNDVQVDLDNVRMTGDSADFNYDQVKKALKSMMMEGDVHVTDQQHFASSERAQILFDKNEFILSGNPKVVQNDNELRGEEIRLINGGKEVKVLRAHARVENEGGT